MEFGGGDVKKSIYVVGVLACFYVGLWVFGEHGYTYDVDPAKQAGAVWTCPPGEQGLLQRSIGRFNPQLDRFVLEPSMRNGTRFTISAQIHQS